MATVATTTTGTTGRIVTTHHLTRSAVLGDVTSLRCDPRPVLYFVVVHHTTSVSCIKEIQEKSSISNAVLGLIQGTP